MVKLEVMKAGCEKTMIKTIFFGDVLSFGESARLQRVCRRQTQQDMADVTSVSRKDIELFETDQRLSPIIKRKLLRAYDLIVETEKEKRQFN